jgi:cytochrome c5
MSQSEDKAFIRKFSGIIIGLLLLTIILIFVARSLHTESGEDANPSQKIIAEERIKPVSAVHTSGESAADLAAAPESTAPTPPPDSVTEEDSGVDGEAIYSGLCETCHEAGIAGAPISGSDQMAERLSEKGLETLVTNAINGLNVMPPRGGNPSLTDEQIRAAVEFMLP